jgi:hypothetical protein
MLYLRTTGFVELAKQENNMELSTIQRMRSPPKRPLELLHMVLFGPVAYLSIGGNKYGLVIVHDFSCFTCVFFFLGDKGETQ